VEEYQVWNEGLEIGSIVVPPNPGDKLSLAGLTWQVMAVDARNKRVSVKPATGESTISWRGSTGDVHTRILQRMRQVLLEDAVYPYLQAGAKHRLQEARQLAKKHGLGSASLFPLDEEGYCYILPWAGTVAVRTLERYLRMHCRETLKTRGVTGRPPYYLVVNLGTCKLGQLHYEIKSLGDRRMSIEELLAEDEAPKLQKYDEFIPPELLRKAFATDYLNLKELAQLVKTW
jgi:ATP-dependent Lhr-like helicase